MLIKNFLLSLSLLVCVGSLQASNDYTKAPTSNQEIVGAQFDTISQTGHGLLEVVNHYNNLESPDQLRFLSKISGEQYTTLFTSAEMVNRQFIRHLYDPLRPLISNPCSYLDEVYDMCSYDGIEIWGSGSVNRGFLSGNRNAEGFKMSGYDVSVGAQKRLTSTWLLGGAFCYSMQHTSYNIGGSSKDQGAIGALYTLYRPSSYYFLTNLTFGVTEVEMHRRFKISRPNPKYVPPGERKAPPATKKDGEKAAEVKEEPKEIEHNFMSHAKPKISQVSFYSEIGKDFIWDCFLIQPFVGIEAEQYRRKCVIEKNAAPLNLVISKKDLTSAFSRVGFHLSALDYAYDVNFAFDLAWQYRLTSPKTDLGVQFVYFGEPFKITGIPVERNSIDVCFNASTGLMDGWLVYIQAAGQKWSRVSNYNFTLGLMAQW